MPRPVRQRPGQPFFWAAGVANRYFATATAVVYWVMPRARSITAFGVA
jgi:hypothetical protein